MSFAEDSFSYINTSPNGKRRSTLQKQFQNPQDLLMSVNSVVKNRVGSVLARQMILKSDHFEMGFDAKLDINLHGVF